MSAVYDKIVEKMVEELRREIKCKHGKCYLPIRAELGSRTVEVLLVCDEEECYTSAEWAD
ncbi:MAG: hypothetical protein ACP5I3_10975 [Thermoproteus sp.]